MASYRGHLAFSTSLGFVYGGLAHNLLDVDPATSALAAGVTAVGGLLPDLDSDSGVPVRELFGLAAALVPLLLLRRLANTGLSGEEVLLFLAVVYLVIRYPFATAFKWLTVHRGMFHSVPATLIAGLVVYLAFDHDSLQTRIVMAAGVMIGFLSHLLLDEMCSVDFRGLTPKLNKFAGSAMKFASKSVVATVTTYGVLAGLGYLAVRDYEANTGEVILPLRTQVDWSPKASPALDAPATKLGAPNPLPIPPSPAAPSDDLRLTGHTQPAEQRTAKRPAFPAFGPRGKEPRQVDRR